MKYRFHTEEMVINQIIAKKDHMNILMKVCNLMSVLFISILFVISLHTTAFAAVDHDYYHYPNDSSNHSDQGFDFGKSRYQWTADRINVTGKDKNITIEVQGFSPYFYMLAYDDGASDWSYVWVGYADSSISPKYDLDISVYGSTKSLKKTGRYTYFSYVMDKYSHRYDRDGNRVYTKSSGYAMRVQAEKTTLKIVVKDPGKGIQKLRFNIGTQWELSNSRHTLTHWCLEQDLTISGATLTNALNQAYGHEHKWQWTHDSTNHWQKCTVSGCTATQNKAPHTYGSWSGWSNISETQQRHERSCSVCGNIEYGYQARPYYLNLNGTLDNKSQASIAGYGRADVYINGSLVSQSVEDYYTAHPYGTSYKIIITAASGKQAFGKTTFEGTIGAGNVEVKPDIRTIFTIGYDLAGGNESGNQGTYNIGSNTFTLKNPTRIGYHFIGWIGSNGTVPQTTVTISKGSTGNRTYKANWTPILYKITYKLFGGISDNPGTYTIETATFNLKTPTLPSGYIFTGWTGSNGQTPDTMVTIHEGTYGSLHFNANYEPVTTGRHSQTEGIENRIDYKNN